MPENTASNISPYIRVRHRGRGSQMWIYLGKLLRMFLYQNDWKVLPMSALIAGLVGMVIRNRMFLNMEGSLMGAFALVMVCIWNGCFNSIQVVCRERDVIKREHRSGMHISSYIASHMVYQALLCLLQTGVTLYVTKTVGIRYPSGGLFTRWYIVDFGISMFLISYASDMLSLWVSCLSRSTTTAMTIMPFVLIFQLVFSGGLLSLPGWAVPLTNYTISNPGIRVLTSQTDYNHQPLATAWDTVSRMRDSEIGGTFTVGQILDLLTDTESTASQEIRALEFGRVFTVGELDELVENSETFRTVREKHVLEDVSVGDALQVLRDSEEFRPYLERKLVPDAETEITFGDVLDELIGSEDLAPMRELMLTHVTTVGDVVDAVKSTGILDQYRDTEVGGTATVGQVADTLAGNADVQAQREKSFTVKTTVGKLIELLGEDNVRTALREKTAEASYKADYEYSHRNILENWIRLCMFIMVFAALSVITLEFIDKDKR